MWVYVGVITPHKASEDREKEKEEKEKKKKEKQQKAILAGQAKAGAA